jgi:hypothetical protein
MEDQEDKLYCPNCGSSQLVANKKGFGAGKALTGAVLTGGIGLLAGFIGSGKVKVTCLKCGCKWNPGELLTKEQKDEKENYVKEKIAKEQYEDNSNGKLSSIITWIIIIVFFAIIILFSK